MKNFMKKVLIIIACAVLTGCQGVDSSDDAQKVMNIQTETVAEVTTVPRQETIYDRYPELSEYDIFSQYYERAEEILSGMTFEQKAGQLFWLKCPDDQTKAVEYIKAYNPGGYILSDNHFEKSTYQLIQEMTADFQNNSAFPMAVICNEEGGDAVTISQYYQFRASIFFSPQMLYRIGGFEEISRDTREKCDFLKNMGINVNLAPVADVSENAQDYIYTRTFGRNANETSEYVKVSVRAYNESGVSCVLKHFPGHGSNDDTYHTASLDKRNYEQLASVDFIPFIEGIKINAPCIMVNHNTVVDLDMDNPASLSKKIHEILRVNLGFTGLIVTDDLSMTAVTDKFNEVDAFLNAIEAGNDIIITSKYEMGLPAVVKAAQTGKISDQRLNTSVIRILAWKLSYGIMS